MINENFNEVYGANFVTEAMLTDDIVGAAELKVSDNGTDGQVLKSAGDGTFSWGDFLPLSGGTMTGAGSVNLPQDFKLQLGTGDVAEIYHDGTHFIVKNTEGQFNIEQAEVGSNITFKTSSTSASDTTALTISPEGNANFYGKASSPQTAAGDSSSTLTTKSYIDNLITGATIYKGTWLPGAGYNNGYGSPGLNEVIQVSGFYYICSAYGSATPNGAGTEPNSWNVGDWVIWNAALDGGSGAWQKIDNSSVLSGAGQGRTVPLWQGADTVLDSETLGNSPISVNQGSGITTITGNLVAVLAETTTATTQLTGNNTTRIATTAFATAAAAAVPIANYLPLAGGTLTGGLTINHSSGDSLVLTKSTTEPSLRFEGDTDKDFVLTVSGETFTITQNDGGTDILSLDHDTKNATFAGNVNVSGSSKKLSLKAGAQLGFEDSTPLGTINLYNDGGQLSRLNIGGTMWVQEGANVGIGTDSPLSILHAKGGSIATPSSASDFITNATARLVVNHSNEYGAYIGYLNSTNDATGIQSSKSNGVTTPLSLNPYGGNIGIGTDSPSAKLHVKDDTGTEVTLLQLESSYNNPSGNKSIAWSDATNDTGRISVDYTSPMSKMRFGSLYNSGYQTSDLMVIQGDGNVGIGTPTPGAKLDVIGNVDATTTIKVKNTNSGSDATARFVAESDSGNIQLKAVSSTNSTYGTTDCGVINCDTMSGGLKFAHNDVTRMTITSGGSVGINVTPSSVWSSFWKPLQINSGSAIAGYTSGTSTATSISTNNVTVGNTYIAYNKYLVDGAASLYLQDVDGEHSWYNAPSGTAGDAIAYTERMRILSTGGITFNGDTSTSNALDDYEEGTFTGYTTGGTSNISSLVYSEGIYTKIGRLVNISLRVRGTIANASAETYFPVLLPVAAPSLAVTNAQYSVGTYTLVAGSGANRFGIGSVYMGSNTDRTTKTMVFIAANQMNSSGSIDGRLSYTYTSS